MLVGVPIIFSFLADPKWDWVSLWFYSMCRCVSLALPLWCIMVISYSVYLSCCISRAICYWFEDVDSYNSTRKIASYSIVRSADAWYSSRVDFVARSLDYGHNYLILEILVDNFKFDDFLLKIFKPIFELVLLFLGLVELSLNGAGNVLFLLLQVLDLSLHKLVFPFKILDLVFKVVHDQCALLLKFIKLIREFIEFDALIIVQRSKIFVWRHFGCDFDFGCFFWWSVFAS